MQNTHSSCLINWPPHNLQWAVVLSISTLGKLIEVRYWKIYPGYFTLDSLCRKCGVVRFVVGVTCHVLWCMDFWCNALSTRDCGNADSHFSIYLNIVDQLFHVQHYPDHLACICTSTRAALPRPPRNYIYTSISKVLARPPIIYMYRIYPRTAWPWLPTFSAHLPTYSIVLTI